MWQAYSTSNTSSHVAGLQYFQHIYVGKSSPQGGGGGSPELHQWRQRSAPVPGRWVGVGGKALGARRRRAPCSCAGNSIDSNVLLRLHSPQRCTCCTVLWNTCQTQQQASSKQKGANLFGYGAGVASVTLAESRLMQPNPATQRLKSRQARGPHKWERGYRVQANKREV